MGWGSTTLRTQTHVRTKVQNNMFVQTNK